MKKIILLFAFTALGYLASNAQTVDGKSQSRPQTAVATAPQGAPTVAKSDSKEAVDSKKDNCSAAEKKSCGKAGGKSCCAKKSMN